MADELIRIAAERQLQDRPTCCSRPKACTTSSAPASPIAETEDQLRAIDDVLEDLASAGRWTG